MGKVGRVVKLTVWACALAALSAALPGSSGAWAQTAPYVAGVQPDQRPAGAPKIGAYDKSGDWLARATRGVEKPHPPSLKFLDDQGAWYTPFTRPGMTGPYDIRRLHQPPGGKPRKSASR